MIMRTFPSTHSGRAVLYIAGAAFLLAWPPALPWIAAVTLVQLGVRHLILAFKEADRDRPARADLIDGRPLPAPGDGERGLADAGRRPIHTRSQVQ
jgi:hypothetical protein